MNRYRVALGKSALSFSIVLGSSCLLGIPFAAASSNSVKASNVQIQASTICSKVSIASIAAIVGHSVPAGVAASFNVPSTAKNGNISGKLTSCTFGVETTAAALAKVVVLETETTSKALTLTEFQQEAPKALAASGVKVTLTSYPGLSSPAVYFAENDSGIHAQGISVLSGTQNYGAVVFSAGLTKAKLADLAKLAKVL